MPAPEIYAFGEFTLDATGRSLSRGGAVIHLAPKAHDLLVALVRQAGHAIALAPKAYDLLVMLVRNGGRVLTKRELLTSLWPECSVDEDILSVHVAGLRKALGDVAHAPRFIETVRPLGYRFIASVTLVHLEIAMSYYNQRRYDDAIDWAARRCSSMKRTLLRENS